MESVFKIVLKLEDVAATFHLHNLKNEYGKVILSLCFLVSIKLK